MVQPSARVRESSVVEVIAAASVSCRVMAEKDLLSILDELVKQAEDARDAARTLDDSAEVAQLKEALETRGEIGS